MLGCRLRWRCFKDGWEWLATFLWHAEPQLFSASHVLVWASEDANGLIFITDNRDSASSCDCSVCLFCELQILLELCCHMSQNLKNLPAGSVKVHQILTKGPAKEAFIQPMGIIQQRWWQATSDKGRPTDNDGPCRPVRPDQGFHLATTSQEIRDQAPGTNPLVTRQQIQHCDTKSKADAISMDKSSRDKIWSANPTLTGHRRNLMGPKLATHFIPGSGHNICNFRHPPGHLACFRQMEILLQHTRAPWHIIGSLRLWQRHVRHFLSCLIPTLPNRIVFFAITALPLFCEEKTQWCHPALTSPPTKAEHFLPSSSFAIAWLQLCGRSQSCDCCGVIIFPIAKQTRVKCQKITFKFKTKKYVHFDLNSDVANGVQVQTRSTQKASASAMTSENSVFDPKPEQSQSFVETFG